MSQDLLNRRLRCLANYEYANRQLEKSRAKNRDIPIAEEQQQKACEKFENISSLAKQGYICPNDPRVFNCNFSLQNWSTSKSDGLLHSASI